MKKLIGFSLMLVLAAVCAEAAPGVRGAKGAVSITVAPLVVGISTGPAFTSNNSPAVLYSVILGTGAVTDFLAVYDTTTAVGIGSALQTNGFVTRFYPSATATTQVTFDPPIQFNKGLVAANSTALMSSVIVYEKGRKGD